MKVLIIGGTRLLGKRIVELLIASTKYEITIISRNAAVVSDQCRFMKGERSSMLKSLKGESFDFVFDFIAYSSGNVREVIDNIQFGRYIFISTSWIVKLNKRCSIEDFIMECSEQDVASLPEVTRGYLLEKWQSELFIKNNIDNDKYTILRLPIFFGTNDHTGRLDFYVSRFMDDHAVICIDGGKNSCQIAFVEDLAFILTNFFIENSFQGHSILEATPPSALTVFEFMSAIKKITGSRSEITSIPADILQVELPEYLSEEPLWRENYVPIGSNNLFKLAGQSPMATESWLNKLLLQVNSPTISDLRRKELDFLKKFV